MTENSRINVIFDETLRVLPETKLFEPVPNLLHRGHQTDFSLPALMGGSKGSLSYPPRD